MSVPESYEHPDATGADQSGMDGSLYCRFRLPDSKLPVAVSIVNIDSENYMLRGISPAPEQRRRSFSLSGFNNTSKSQLEKDLDMLLHDTTNTDVVPNATSCCARAVSFHTLLCSCRMSCCCMCGILCSPDCHTCFHKLCIGFAANYACKKNSDKLPPVTLHHEKVSL